MGKRRKKSRVFAQVRHLFLLKWEDATGKVHELRAWAKVRHAKRPVVIRLLADHVRRSIKLHGVGDTANCSGSVCTVHHAKAFPHPVEGHCDWTYTRVFVVSKVDYNGLPSECYVYEHDDPQMAKLNDSLGGQQKLLALIEKDGPREIILSPKRIRSKPGRPGKGRKKVGTRDPIKRQRMGRLRYAVAKLASQQPEEGSPILDLLAGKAAANAAA